LIGNRQGKKSLAFVPKPLFSIFGEQSGSGTDFSWSTSVFPVILIPPMLSIHSSVIREQDNDLKQWEDEENLHT
jgi:hypothetical protein